MSAWWRRMAPIFSSFQAEEYLCDLWFVCDGLRVAAHRLVLAPLVSLAPQTSLLDEILSDQSPQSFITLAGWEPDKISRMVSNLYTSGMFQSTFKIFNFIHFFNDKRKHFVQHFPQKP